MRTYAMHPAEREALLRDARIHASRSVALPTDEMLVNWKRGRGAFSARDMLNPLIRQQFLTVAWAVVRDCYRR